MKRTSTKINEKKHCGDKTISRPKLSTNWISILGKKKSNISGKRSVFFFMALHHGTILCYLNTNTGAKADTGGASQRHKNATIRNK